MSTLTITDSLLTGIANAIRGKNGSSDQYTPAHMATAIQAIPTGITPTGTKNITANGQHDVTDYATANVSVQPNLQSKTATQNGTVTPDSGYDGLSSVTINVSGGGGGGTSLNYYLGRLKIDTGVIDESSEYCYSDLIPISTGTGQWFLDVTRSDVENFYMGISFFGQDGVTNVGYIRQYTTYRSYYANVSNAKYFRIANKVSNLSFANVAFLKDGLFVVPQAANVYQANLTQNA